METNQMQGYLEARRLACQRLSGMDPVQIARNAGCVYDESSRVLFLRYLNRDYRIGCVDWDIAGLSDKKAPSLPVQVLMLHYLVHASGRPLSGRLVSFREVHGGGAVYWPVFEKRAIRPLLRAFEKRPDALLDVGRALGGTPAPYGDAGVTVHVFPLLPVTYVLYLGDEEMPASASVLFDASVDALLPCEDIVLAAGFGAYALIGQAG